MAKKPISQRLRRRAEQIINSDAYEQDTRNAVKQALKERDADNLAETVRQAERGDHICDTTIIDREQRAAAGLTLRLLESNIPGWLRAAIIDAITQAGALARCPTPADFKQGQQERERLFDLFAVTNSTRFTLKPTPRAAIAAHLSAILKHPDDVPADLYNAIADAYMSLVNAAVMDTPEMIERVLALHEASESQVESTEAQQRRDLARQITAALNHPALPAQLKQGFYEALNEFENEVDLNKLCYSPPAIAHALELYADEQKGAAD